MIASEMVKKYGKSLIGQSILTQAVGKYPGGVAKVINLGDKCDTSIVMNVFNEDWRDEDGNQEMGVFNWEAVAFSRGPVLATRTNPYQP